jgi:hypothetical protein
MPKLFFIFQGFQVEGSRVYWDGIWKGIGSSFGFHQINGG